VVQRSVQTVYAQNKVDQQLKPFDAHSGHISTAIKHPCARPG